MSVLSCNTELPDHIEQECNDFPKGGSPSLGILLPGHGITDFSSADQWNAAKAAGKARIINRTKFDQPAPSENMVDNPVACGAEQINDGFNWTAHWVDANVNIYNDNFYQALNVTVAAFAWYNCDTNKIRLVNKNATFIAKPIFPASNKEFQNYDVMAYWSTGADEFPTLVDAPAGIFGTGE